MTTKPNRIYYYIASLILGLNIWEEKRIGIILMLKGMLVMGRLLC